MTADGWTPPETWLVVYDLDGQFLAMPNEESSIDSAVTTLLTDGKDALLHVVLVTGEEYAVLASCVRGWLLSTPSARARGREHAAFRKREALEHSRRQGWSPDADE